MMHTETTAKAQLIDASDIQPGDLLTLGEGFVVAVDMRLMAKEDDRVLVFVAGWRHPLAVDRYGEQVSVYRGS